ncbi:MAG: Gfo/Idh/MocA family protein [Planctomycetota bacterium]|jgi:UDP-N-acetyl-2-amino-2-deoxyglucuronate dehydrogenase
MKQRKFALIGAAGFVAPRHMQAIKDVGGLLVAAYDLRDSVGILDSYFPECLFYTDWARFDGACQEIGIDFVVVCTPNHIHVRNCLWALSIGADVVCEKPLALHSSDLELLRESCDITHQQINVIMQLRNGRPTLANLKTRNAVNVYYHTPRGNWYHKSWKGDNKLSGGLATNIGVHLFDWLLWHFGPAGEINLDVNDRDTISGYLELERADVTFTLSIDKTEEMKPRRDVIVNNQMIRFDGTFEKLHTASYAAILTHQGWTIEDVAPSIKLIERMRNL